MDQKIKELYWLIGKKSHLSIDKKLLIYKTVIKPIWTYGIELWGCASKSNVALYNVPNPKYFDPSQMQQGMSPTILYIKI
jgi:hypothetical protein